MGKLLLAILVLTAVAYFTKPTDAKIKDKVFAGIKSDDFAASVIGAALRNTVDIEDRFLFKTFSVSLLGKTRDLGWAAFGYIHLDKD